MLVESEDWNSKVNILENFIKNESDDSKYFILFDELDEDYKDVIKKYQSHNYLDLIIGLFKSVQDVRATFKMTRGKILPVIFLRDDIYELLQDSDKNKWNDLRVDLSWNENKIRSLLAFRISRTINPSGEILPFNDAWAAAFEPGAVPVGFRQQQRMDAFKYIARSTLLRPRDFVRYLQVAAEEQLDHAPLKRIGPSTIRSADKAFSNYLRSEFVDEIHAIIPEIDEVLDIISQLRKQSFRIEEFSSAFESSAVSASMKEFDVNVVLKVLYHFSVIGNLRNKMQFFKYINR